MFNKKILSISLVLILVVGIMLSFSNSTDAWWVFGGDDSKGQDKVKIGFLVKQPEESWFQDEWKYAQQAADELGFELIKIGASSGEEVLSAIDNLAAQGAQGFVICTPDVKLGPAIAAKAKLNDLKLISVDDRFVGSNGKLMEDVHHVGISAYNIGKLSGKTLAEQLKVRGWDLEKVGYLKMTYDQLPTIAERTYGATDVLLDSGFPEANVFETPMRTLDTEGSFDAANSAITKNSDIEHWLIAGGNDVSVIGAVRALEGQGFNATDVIGVGINGSNFAINEFEKDEATGFYATIKLSAKAHGYETATMMYNWITNGEEPPKVTWTSGTLMNRANYQELMN
jgi:L-arabinose transport system substrate-binding protein